MESLECGKGGHLIPSYELGLAWNFLMVTNVLGVFLISLDLPHALVYILEEMDG